MPAELITTLRELRRSGRINEARELLAQAQRDQPDPKLAFLAWQHAEFWWLPLQGKRITLRRRGPEDAALVRRCWSDADFMGRFNRLAMPLPESDEALKAILAREHWALAEESHALHWTVHVGASGCGFVSLVDIVFSHRRAEFLIGVTPGTNVWVGPEAAHLALQFAARQMKLERLSAHFYPENPSALRAAEKLGFEREGLLRGYLRLPDADPCGGRRADLIVAGLLLDEPFFERSARLRARLLGKR